MHILKTLKHFEWIFPFVYVYVRDHVATFYTLLGYKNLFHKNIDPQVREARLSIFVSWGKIKYDKTT